ncbi:MAG: TatD family hydrolase [Cephaloticoccus sp.]|nr:TatD family hydrolase [Cephaloticoccus sp.]MCF7759117.1 TatD family hydrolase [Cephaloticoccus sp.]
MKLYDAHLHLQDEWLLPHLDRIAADLAAIGIAGAVVNGTTPDDWPQVSALAGRFPWVVPSYGVHPWDCGNRPTDWQGRLESRLATEPRARVGEIGLDRWILDRAKPDDPRLTGLRRAPLDEQLEVFVWQLELAATHGLAVSIHCIDAWGALLDALRTVKRPVQGFLLHAYAGPVEMIKTFADLGAYFSFNGSYLDPKRDTQRNVFKSVPADRLLVETDAPAMPLRNGWRRHELPVQPDGTLVNHPANIAGVYAGLSDFLGQRVDMLAAQVEQNFTRLYL